MKTLSKKPPKITVSKGYAYLKIDGKVKYLRKAETDAAERRYHEYIKERGFTVPKNMSLIVKRFNLMG